MGTAIIRETETMTTPLDDRDDVIVSIENLAVSDLNVDMADDGYQRIAWPHVVEKIVRDFDPRLYEPLAVSMRDDGSYWVIDGHHRLEAARLMDMERVPCRLIYGLTREEEATLFVRAALSRKKIDPYDRYRAEISAKRPNAMAFRQAMWDAGFMPDRSSAYQPSEIHADVKYPVRAIAACIRIWEIDEGATLSVVLDIVRRAWGQTDPKTGTRATMILALSRIVARYDGLVVDTLVDVLRKTAPSVVLGNGQSRATTLGIEARVSVAIVMVELYNRAVRGDNKLPVDRVM